MNLIIIWVGFTIVVSTFYELDVLQYFMYNLSLLLFTYLHNSVTPSKIPFNVFILLSSFPSFVILYIILIYENFLFIDFFTQFTVKNINTIFKHYNVNLKKRFLIMCVSFTN